MEGAQRQAQNNRRMDSARSGSICRRFMNGFCRFGQSCHYRHERPVTPAGQICRYFQKGGCWYGERCRYLHVLQSEVNSTVADRRSSVPTVSSSTVAYAPPDRRGSEPALLQSEATSRQYCGRSELVVKVANPQHNIGRLAADIAEEQSLDTVSHLTASRELSQNAEVAQAFAPDGKPEQETSPDETTDGATAAAAAAATATASGTQENIEERETFLQSKNVTCGICMEKVYENLDPRKRVFGILPNCNHSYCLHCILTWRKTKDLGLDTVKSCPQCRIRSPFYVPNKYWVEGPAKESLIAAFKEKFRIGRFHGFSPGRGYLMARKCEKSCSYYTRYRCCPFKTECLYRHDKRARQWSFLYPSEDEDDCDGVDLLNLFIAMTFFSGDDEDVDNDDKFNFALYLSEEYGF